MFGPDICLCTGGLVCPLKNTCLRYYYHTIDKPEWYATYFTTPPINKTETKTTCNYYIKHEQ